MKERPIIIGAESVRAILEGRKTQTRRVVKDSFLFRFDDLPRFWGQDKYLKKRMLEEGQFQVGDRLWVRETAIISPKNFDDKRFCNSTDNEGDARIVQYLATNPCTDGAKNYGLKPKSPLFMPRWASRITLEIADIRVERLQDITGEDALKEGFCNYGTDVDTLDAFCEAWQKLNAKRSYPWENNDWVWVITFKVVQS